MGAADVEGEQPTMRPRGYLDPTFENNASNPKMSAASGAPEPDREEGRCRDVFALALCCRTGPTHATTRRSLQATGANVSAGAGDVLIGRRRCDVIDGAHTTHDRAQRTISAGDPGLITSREGYRGVAKSPDARIKISFVRRSSWFSRSKILS